MKKQKKNKTSEVIPIKIINEKIKKKRNEQNRLNSLKLPQTKRQKLLQWQTNGQ